MPSRSLDDAAPRATRVETTTCYMCACRCGIRVHVENERIRYIDGNPDHPINRGVICGKGSAGIRQHEAPSRLRAPMLRTGERGEGSFREISWDEALALATRWLDEARAQDPRRLAFFTGRDQSQALTGWWAKQYGTPNYAAHGGFCSVNMAAAGLYTFGGSFWEFGEPDWERTRYFMLFGVAEDHSSNPIKIGLGKLKARGAKIVAINPVRTGYNAIADEWLGVRPGTDGLLVGALIHELLRTQQVDLDYLVRYTNAHWLVIDAPGAADDGLFARDADGHALAWNHARAALVRGAELAALDQPQRAAALHGRHRLADGREAVPVFEHLARRYLDSAWAPESVARATGIPVDTIRRIARELGEVAFRETITLPIRWTDWTGRVHESVTGRPVSMHAMRGISAHSNGFQTCRLIHLLQILLGTIDVPGGFRYRAPYPRPAPPPLRPGGRLEELRAGGPLGAMPLGFPSGPEDLLVDSHGAAVRIDKAYSWDAPLAVHGQLHRVIANAAQGDPHPIDLLFLYMANMSWNSAMNVTETQAHLTAKNADGSYRIPRIIYSDAYRSEMVAFADLVLPDTTYLERWDCISLLDRPISDPDAPADAIRHPVVRPDRDVRAFQDVLIDLGARLALPGFVNADGTPKFPDGYPDYIVHHERVPGIGSLAGWRGADGTQWGRGTANPQQLERYVANGSFCAHELEPAQRWLKHANRGYLEFARAAGFLAAAEPIVFQLWCEPLQRFRLAARGHGAVQPPDSHRARIERYFDPLPFWYAPFEDATAESGALAGVASWPLHAITQRPMAMYHSWGSQNEWLRQIHGWNRLYLHRARAARLGIADGEWVQVSSRAGAIRAQVALMDGVNEDTVWTWNAIAKRRGAWALEPEAPEFTRAFLLNPLIPETLADEERGYRHANCDPVTGQAAWYDLRVRIERLGAA